MTANGSIIHFDVPGDLPQRDRPPLGVREDRLKDAGNDYCRQHCGIYLKQAAE